MFSTGSKPVVSIQQQHEVLLASIHGNKLACLCSFLAFFLSVCTRQFRKRQPKKDQPSLFHTRLQRTPPKKYASHKTTVFRLLRA